MRGRLSILLGALCLHGCGKAPERSNSDAGNQIASAARPDPMAQLRTLAPAQRSAVLYRAISDSDRSCNSVTDSFYQQDYNKMAMFVARCSGVPPYAVFVSPGGFAQVRACANLGENVPTCRVAGSPGDERDDSADSRPRKPR